MSVLVSSHGCEWAADNVARHLATASRQPALRASVVRRAEPCDLKIMVGWYTRNGGCALHQNEMTAAKRRVVWWVGTDIRWLEEDAKRDGGRSAAWLNENVDEHWAEWPLSERRLRACGIENVRVVHMPTRRLYDPLPLPSRFTVGVYGLEGHPVHQRAVALKAAALTPWATWFAYPARRRREGNIEYMPRIAPDKMGDYYREMSMLVRVVAADGMPQGPMEAAMCGRQVVYNICQLPYMTWLQPVTAQALASCLERIRDHYERGQWYNAEGAAYWRGVNDPRALVEQVERILAADEHG